MKPILFQALIDIDKWNAARWTATAFLHDPEGKDHPWLGLVFENTEVGNEIFADLQKRLGRIDEFEELYVSVVEGEILGEEPGYTIHLSSDPLRTLSRLKAEGKDLDFDKAMILSRFHRMTPAPDSPHLANFKSAVQTHGRFGLLPVSSDMHPQFDYAIAKTAIHFRNASDITATDRDAAVFPPNYFQHRSVH